jgi:hypothetical protein
MTSSKSHKGSSASNAASGSNVNSSGNSSVPLSIAYPVNSYVELSIATPTAADANTTGQISTLKGMIYTTDSISNTVVLIRSLPNTSLYDMHMINASSIVGCEFLSVLPEVTASGSTNSGTNNGVNSNASAATTSNHSLQSLLERERRAIKLATESLTQINANATPRAQMIFDLLVKGCNVVSWGEGDSIIVLNQVRVDPPYKPESCTWIGSNKSGEKETKSLEEGSLERVKRIVGSRT